MLLSVFQRAGPALVTFNNISAGQSCVFPHGRPKAVSMFVRSAGPQDGLNAVLKYISKIEVSKKVLLYHIQNISLLSI